MSLVPTRRIAGAAAVAAAVALGLTCTGVAMARPTAIAAAGPTQKTITASLITRTPQTLAPGSKVSASSLGQRVFTDSRHGFALADVGQAQYSAATSDGGKTWKTDSPALHVNAAQAPLVVLSVGAASRSTIFAFGGGQVVDTTSDGGKKWYRALFNSGLVMAVVRNTQRHLVAFVDGQSGSGNSSGVTWQYVSKNGGRTWRYDTTIGGS